MECAREVAFMIYCTNNDKAKVGDKYRLWPLTIDPSAEEIERLMEMSIKSEQEEGLKRYNSYKERGFL